MITADIGLRCFWSDVISLKKERHICNSIWHYAKLLLLKFLLEILISMESKDNRQTNRSQIPVYFHFIPGNIFYPVIFIPGSQSNSKHCLCPLSVSLFHQHNKVSLQLSISSPTLYAPYRSNRSAALLSSCSLVLAVELFQLAIQNILKIIYCTRRKNIDGVINLNHNLDAS